MKKSKARHWWAVVHFLLCVLLGYAAYRTTSWWLTQQPLWTLERTRFDTVFLPLTESSDGKYLIATERTLRQGKALKQPALVVLDQQTGKVLHETADNASHSDFGEDDFRLVGDTVWRVHYQGPGLIELRRWRFTKDENEQVVHTWRNDTHRVHVTVDWSQDSRRVVLQHQASYLPFLLVPVDVITRCYLTPLFRYSDLAVSWIETWEIPVDDHTAPQFLGRWSPHYSRWRELGTLSNDGKLIAFPDKFSFHWTRKPRIGYQKRLQGEALLNIFREKPSGCLVYETRTGELRHHLQPPGYHFLRSVWFGNTLVSLGYEADDRIMTPQEIFHPPGTGFVFYYMAKEKNIAHQFAGDQVLPVRWPAELADCDLYASVVNHVLAVQKRNDEGRSDVFMLNQQGNNLVVQHTIREIRDVNFFSNVWMLNGCDQLIAMDMPPPDPIAEFRNWLSTFPLLKKWISAEVQGARAEYYLYTSATRDQYGISLGHWCLNPNKHNLTHLYLMSTEKEEENDISFRSLSCYTMPLVIYSNWWGRAE